MQYSKKYFSHFFSLKPLKRDKVRHCTVLLTTRTFCKIARSNNFQLNKFLKRISAFFFLNSTFLTVYYVCVYVGEANFVRHW